MWMGAVWVKSPSLVIIMMLQHQQAKGHYLRCDGLILEHFPMRSMATDFDIQWIVGVSIGHRAGFLLCPAYLNIYLSQSAFEQRLATQLITLALPFNYQMIVDNPSLRHLIQLLQAEIQTPQVMNQMFVWSIATVLILQILKDQPQNVVN
jgi:hypothetical protein